MNANIHKPSQCGLAPDGSTVVSGKSSHSKLKLEKFNLTTSKISNDKINA